MSIEQNHFKHFAKTLEVSLLKYKTDEEIDLLVSQREQLKALILLEKKWKKALLDHQWGSSVYKKFIEHICDVRRNILVARPYFRERQTVFTKSISGALKDRREKAIFKFRVNYYFVLFALKQYKWPEKSEIVKIAKEIEKVRRQILEINLPLAISQARIFYACTPKSHLSWMDLVQIHCGGLLIAIDKFVPPDTKKMSDSESLQAYRKFRAVAIGRMISDRIEQYSETVLHFYPADRKKLYRAHKLLRQFKGEIDYDKLAVLVNEGVEIESQKTNGKELANLLASASTVSGDVSVSNDEGDEPETTLERYVVPKETRPEAAVEDLQALSKMKSVAATLPLLERKIIRLKGVYLENAQ